MLNTLKLLLMAALGLALGLAATYAAVERNVNFATIRKGPWSATLGAETADGDPYEAARLASRAQLPLGQGEGVSFLASVDSSGRPLSGRCSYVVGKEVPAARYWSLSLLTPQGRPEANPARRYGFTSAELLRAPNGDFAIVVSGQARPGNWLPIGLEGRRFRLMLRLYDTPIAASVSSLDSNDLPSISRSGCR